MSHKLTPICKPVAGHIHQLVTTKASLPYAHALHHGPSSLLTDDQMMPPQRQSSFDKIINRFEIPRHQHNKENSPTAGHPKNRAGRDQHIVTERGRSTQHNNYEPSSTERIKQNLSKLRSHYCFLPDIGQLKKRRPTVEIEMEDYSKFDKRSDHAARFQSGQRKPLGFLKIGKLRYQKSMVLLNQ